MEKTKNTEAEVKAIFERILPEAMERYEDELEARAAAAVRAMLLHMSGVRK